MHNLLQKADDTDWEEIFHEENIDGMWTMLKSKLLALIDSTIPEKTVEILSTDKSQMTPVTKALINKIWSASRAKDWSKFNHLKMKVRREV